MEEVFLPTGDNLEDRNNNKIIQSDRLLPVRYSTNNTEIKQTEVPNFDLQVSPQDSTLILGPASDQQADVITRIEDYLSSMGHYRHNEVIGKVEYKLHEDEQYCHIADRMVNTMCGYMKKERIPATTTFIRQVLNSKFSPIYNPFADYFENLPQWDETVDHIKEYAATVTTTNDEMFQNYFKKWIVAVVAGAIQDEVVNHTALVFSGPQGIGKTTWLMNLVPPSLKNYAFSGTINPDNKDTSIMLSECLFINLDELESLNKSSMGALKDCMTKNVIRIRRPYGYHPENLVRRASFMGSVNHKEFLNDTTGSRRFLCFDVSAIEYQHNKSIDLVYSQAYSLCKSGYKYWFDGSEIDAINVNNEQYRMLSVEEDLLLYYFESCNLEKATDFLSATEILKFFADDIKIPITEAAAQRLGRELKKHGFLKLKRKDRTVYALRKKDFETVRHQKHYSTTIDEVVTG